MEIICMIKNVDFFHINDQKKKFITKISNRQNITTENVRLLQKMSTNFLLSQKNPQNRDH